MVTWEIEISFLNVGFTWIASSVAHWTSVARSLAVLSQRTLTCMSLLFKLPKTEQPSFTLAAPPHSTGWSDTISDGICLLLAQSTHPVWSKGRIIVQFSMLRLLYLILLLDHWAFWGVHNKKLDQRWHGLIACRFYTWSWSVFFSNPHTVNKNNIVPVWFLDIHPYFLPL